MLDEGIVPFGVVPPGLLQQLNDMTPEQRRKMKRKFRKIWRNAYKKEGLTPYETSDGSISKDEKRRRAWAVFHTLKQEVRKQMNSGEE